MNDEQIKKAIISYIDEKIYNYAVMIDGGWGTGKSYFVKNELLEAIKEHENSKDSRCSGYTAKKVVYISAYGIQQPSELSEQLYTILANNFVKIGISAINIFSKLSFGKVITETSKNTPPTKKASKTKDEKKKKMGIDFDIEGLDLKGLATRLERAIIIIDDIERSNCNINELFGYINGFVEHDGIKVILVANESQITGSHHIENQELKYLVVKPNEEFDYESSDKIDALNRNVQKLFKSQNEYLQIREKLIGKTFNFQPDFKLTVEKLIMNHIGDEVLRSHLLEIISTMSEFATKNKHLNIRTVQFFLSTINEMFELVLKKRSDYQRLLPKIIKCYYTFCFRYKKGAPAIEFDGTHYGNVSLSESRDFRTDNYVFGFKFVDEHIRTGNIDTDLINYALNEYVNEKACESENSEDAVHIIEYQWYYMNDDEITIQLNRLKENLDKNQYAFYNYDKIIRLLSTIAHNGFGKEFFDEYIAKMIENINMANVKQKIYFDSLGVERESYELHKEWVDKLNQVIEEKLSCSKKEKLNRVLVDDNWCSNLMEVTKNSDPTFWNSIDMELLLDKLRIIDSGNMGYFIHTVARLHGDIGTPHDTFDENIKISLEKILDVIENISDDTDKMMPFKKNRLKELLNSILRSYNRDL